MRRILLSSCALLYCLTASFGAFAVTGGGDITFTPKGAKPVVFSHDVHKLAKGLTCNGCHYAMTNGNKIANVTKANFCSKCHNGMKSFDVKNPKNCERCHK